MQSTSSWAKKKKEEEKKENVTKRASDARWMAPGVNTSMQSNEQQVLPVQKAKRESSKDRKLNC